MSAITSVEAGSSAINLVAPRGYVSVQINVRIAAGQAGRYTVASFDVPVATTEETTIDEVRATAFSVVKSYLSPEVARRLPAVLERGPDTV
jgi:hypothetical protein